jgi:cobalamin biosynthesis protein CobD/CbiB
VIDVMQWIAIGLTGVLVLLAHRLLGKHERVIREMAKTLKSVAEISAALANVEVARALRRPLVYCPSHGGQESDDNGRCVKCR